MEPEMTNRATSFGGNGATSSPTTGRSFDLRRAVSLWLSDGKSQGWSRRTLADRQGAMDRFIWWLENEEECAATLDALDPIRIRSFLAYAREPRQAGRYGAADRQSAQREARPSTVHAYYRQIRALVNFCIAEGLLSESPLRNVKAPRVPTDQVQPLNEEQVQDLLDAARRGRTPERDVAIIIVLVDTGLRVSELCQLTVGDVDRGAGELVVTGKGNKRRRVYVGTAARRALWRYIEADRRGAEAGESLFVSVGGHKIGAALTIYGVHQVVARAGRAAKIEEVRCSPHSLRHTFAINFLRGEGNLFELQQLMGHQGLHVLRRYVALAQVDLREAHRAASPADRMKLR
jgi:integrase/recombinase XerD